MPRKPEDKPSPSFRIAVFASGGGSNLQALLDRIAAGDLRVEIAFVLSNNSASRALERARRFGCPAFHVSARTEGSEERASTRLADLCREHQVDLLVLAGYMKVVPPLLLTFLRNRILNIHPALLPSFGGAGFYGHHVHEAVVRHGCQVSGITVHMVNERYDEGQIVLQKAVPLLPGMSAEEVGARVLREEHRLYWRVVRAFAEGRIRPLPGDHPREAVDLAGFRAEIALIQAEPAG